MTRAYQLGTSIFTDGCLCSIRALASAGEYDWCMIGQYSCPRFDGVRQGQVRCSAKTDEAADLARLSDAYERHGDASRASKAGSLVHRVLAKANPPGFRFWTHRDVLECLSGGRTRRLEGQLKLALIPGSPVPPYRKRVPMQHWQRRTRPESLGPVPPWSNLSLAPGLGPDTLDKKDTKFVTPGRPRGVYPEWVSFEQEEEQRKFIAPGTPRRKPYGGPHVKTPFVTPGKPGFGGPPSGPSVILSCIEPSSFAPAVQVETTDWLGGHQERCLGKQLLTKLFQIFPCLSQELVVQNMLDAWGQLPVQVQQEPSPEALAPAGEGEALMDLGQDHLKLLSDYCKGQRRAH